MTDRRAFLRNLATLAAGAIVAPTLAETLAVNAKKYFFLNGNPLRGPFHVNALELRILFEQFSRNLDAVIKGLPPLQNFNPDDYGIPTWQVDERILPKSFWPETPA
jgi:hypothetical protein